MSVLGLRVDNLTVSNGRGRVLLNVPALQIAPGQLVGVRGPSGAGKSTLLNAVAGLLPGASGQVIWGDTDLLALGDEARTGFRAAHMGFIFQDFMLFDELSPLDNASLSALFAPKAKRGGLIAAARAQLGRLGVPEDTRQVASFSGGERQRIAVSRALAANPDVILADEPTASLDRKAADALIADLTGLARDQGKTLLAVSHDPALLEMMDQVVTVSDGQLADDA